MSDIEKIFDNLSPEGNLSDGFEDAVFAKIGKKKKQRKAVVSFAAGFCFAGALYLGVTVIPSLKSTDTKPLMAKSSRVDNFNVKNEVPLSENTYLTSSGQNTEYLVEQVSLETEDGSL